MLPHRQHVMIAHPRLERTEEYLAAAPRLGKVYLRLGIASPVLLMVIVASWFMAANERVHLALRIEMPLISLTILLFVPFFVSTQRLLGENQIRRASRAPLRFVPSWTIPVVVVLAALLLTVAGVVGSIALLLPGAPPIGGIGRYSPVALVPSGLTILGYLLGRARLPRGLAVATDGLTWTEGKAATKLPWEDVRRICLATGRRGRRSVRILTCEHVHYDLAAGILGSDPAIVGEVVQHFLDHPEERELLHDPDAALARVVAPVSSSRRSPGPTSGASATN